MLDVLFDISFPLCTLFYIIFFIYYECNSVDKDIEIKLLKKKIKKLRKENSNLRRLQGVISDDLLKKINRN